LRWFLLLPGSWKSLGIAQIEKDLITSTGRGWEGRSYKQSPKVCRLFVVRVRDGTPNHQSYDHPGWDEETINPDQIFGMVDLDS